MSVSGGGGPGEGQSGLERHVTCSNSPVRTYVAMQVVLYEAPFTHFCTYVVLYIIQYVCMHVPAYCEKSVHTLSSHTEFLYVRTYVCDCV